FPPRTFGPRRRFPPAELAIRFFWFRHPSEKTEEYPLASALEQKLVDLEKKFWESMKAKDLDTALTLTADPVILTGAEGVSRIDKATFGKLMTGAKWTLHDFDIHD